MKTRYALKALTQLALAGRGNVVLIGELAEREGIPQKFLEAILRELKQDGLLMSRKGRGGGYALNQDPKAVTLAQVIRALEGPLAPVPCLSQTAYRRCDECKDEHSCGVRLVLRDLHQATMRVLEGTTLDDLVQRTREAAQEHGTLRYAI
jgi:Rrf2 family protein